MAEVFVVDGVTHEEVENQLHKFRDSIRVLNTFQPQGITIFVFLILYYVFLISIKILNASLSLKDP